MRKIDVDATLVDELAAIEGALEVVKAKQ